MFARQLGLLRNASQISVEKSIRLGRIALFESSAWRTMENGTAAVIVSAICLAVSEGSVDMSSGHLHVGRCPAIAKESASENKRHWGKK